MMAARAAATGVAALAAVTPVVAAVGEKAGGAIMQAPVIWYFLGYPFEAASMIAALFGCVSARLWMGGRQKLWREHLWVLDLPVSAMTMALSATLVVALRPAPLGALLYGAGAGVLGEGVFKLGERYLKASGVIGDGQSADPKP